MSVCCKNKNKFNVNQSCTTRITLLMSHVHITRPCRGIITTRARGRKTSQPVIRDQGSRHLRKTSPCENLNEFIVIFNFKNAHLHCITRAARHRHESRVREPPPTCTAISEL